MKSVSTVLSSCRTPYALGTGAPAKPGEKKVAAEPAKKKEAKTGKDKKDPNVPDEAELKRLEDERLAREAAAIEAEKFLEYRQLRNENILAHVPLAQDES